MSAASAKPKKDFPDCTFCAPCRCDDECGCVGTGCWACGHRYDDVSGAVFAVSERTVSAKPAPSLKDAIHIIESGRRVLDGGDVFFDAYEVNKALVILEKLEAQPAAEKTALKELREKVKTERKWYQDRIDTSTDYEDPIMRAIINKLSFVITEIDAQERAGAKAASEQGEA